MNECSRMPQDEKLKKVDYKRSQVFDDRVKFCLPDLTYTSKSDKHFSFNNNDKMILLVTGRFGLKAHTHRHQVALRRYVMFSRL